MPIYVYQCTICEKVTEEFQHINDDPLSTCGECGSPIKRVPTVPHVQKEFHKPINMYSIGLNNDEEIRAFKQACPDVDVATDQRDELYGIPVARTRGQKLKALKTMGFVENK